MYFKTDEEIPCTCTNLSSYLSNRCTEPDIWRDEGAFGLCCSRDHLPLSHLVLAITELAPGTCISPAPRTTGPVLHLTQGRQETGLPRWCSGKEFTRQCRRHGRRGGQEDPLEQDMATRSSILAWKTPWTEEPDRLQSMGSQSRTPLSRHTPRQEMGGWAEGRSQPQVAFPAGATLPAAPGPTGQPTQNEQPASRPHPTPLRPCR